MGPQVGEHKPVHLWFVYILRTPEFVDMHFRSFRCTAGPGRLSREELGFAARQFLATSSTPRRLMRNVDFVDLRAQYQSHIIICYRLSFSCVNRQRRVKCTAERKDIDQVQLSDLAFCTYSYKRA